jgi:predicted ester cyclase
MSPAEIKARVWRSIDLVWNHGDLVASAELLSPVVNLHFRGTMQPLTIAQLNTIVGYWREAFPDFHFNLDDMVVEGDRASLRLTFTGTHTGNRVVMKEQLTCRLNGGKIVEMWEECEELAPLCYSPLAQFDTNLASV